MEVKLFLQRYRAGKREFDWADLSGADLSGADLSDINLCRANLSSANLQGAVLTNANLFKTNLSGANLQSATLKRANLRKANLTNANLDKADLDDASLIGATLPDGTISPLPEQFLSEPSDEKISFEESNKVEPEASSVHLSTEKPLEIENSGTSSQPAAALWGSLLTLAVGYGCYGLILSQIQAPAIVWWLLWSTVFVGKLTTDAVWMVPVISAIVVIIGKGTTLGSLIFSAVASVAIFVGLWMLGSISGKQFGQILREGMWLCGLGFILISIAPWVADGSRAYIGGGIVLNLVTFHLAILLIVGMALTGVGCAFLVREDPFFRKTSLSKQNRWRFLEFGLIAAVGIASGALLGRI